MPKAALLDARGAQTRYDMIRNFTPIILLAHCASFMSRWPLLRVGGWFCRSLVVTGPFSFVLLLFPNNMWPKNVNLLLPHMFPTSNFRSITLIAHPHKCPPTSYYNIYIHIYLFSGKSNNLMLHSINENNGMCILL